jgi:trehalose 6-phosphate phosphatase
MPRPELLKDKMQMDAEAHYRPGSLLAPDSIDLMRTALLLDIDGTLIDIADTPARVVVPPTLRKTLSNLLDLSGGGVALVSGRTIETIDELFAPLTAPTIGGHGAEIRLTATGPKLKQRPVDLSEPVRKQLHLLAKVDPCVLVEDKSHSIALHYRLAAQQENFLKREVAAIAAADPSDVEILFGKAVIEIKPRLFSKGSAVCELMIHPPFAGRTPLFIGDDTTDESVFGLLPQLAGIGYSVGRPILGAQGTFRSPEHVRSWLARLSVHSRRSR